MASLDARMSLLQLKRKNGYFLSHISLNNKIVTPEPSSNQFVDVAILIFRQRVAPSVANLPQILIQQCTYLAVVVVVVVILTQRSHGCCCNPDLNYHQATRCSFSGKLASDPDSTVYISGCEGKESVDISLMSKKVDACLL